MSDIITKPFEPDVVKSRIKNIIELWRYRRSLESLVAEQSARAAESLSLIHILSGHLCVVNTKAMELLGYGGSGYEVPEGGVVQPDGLLKEQAFLAPHKQKLMQGPGPDQVLKAVGRASRLYASYGITLSLIHI